MSDFSGKKIGVLLSGCGVNDGSEIHEATLTLLALDTAQADIIALAPDAEQAHVIDHAKGDEEKGASRNVLVESARISRGEIKSVKNVTASDLDGLIVPGGFGAAKNLCTFAFDGTNCKVNPDVEQLIKDMYAAKKPMGFICIAPALCAKVLGDFKPKLTIGNDEGTAKAVEEMGGEHVTCKVDEIAVDEGNKIVSTPAYMLGPSISFVAQGITKCVNKVLEMTQ
ncbi:isoprenoid biosynthesis glyoxalase ElbB [candidate division KSB1 bacterium]|nr:isoprenoid biosynthesis glyoxalase ElbB [candidate division KSB1 bacterium]